MNMQNKIKRLFIWNEITTAILVLIMIFVIIKVVYKSQDIAEENAFITGITDSTTSSIKKDQYALAKVAAEIRQIRSDTAGSLFWLKLIALFVTVGGAVGGYLASQHQITKRRLNFEHRKDVDTAYQEIVKELSAKEAVLRAAAAVKMGSILQAFPVEWNVDKRRKKELIQLTKQILAATLSIEQNKKVLKTITISLALYKPWKEEEANPLKDFTELRNIDLSSATARDAYWAKTDFTYADFYLADLSKTSFRNSILQGAQFRETRLIEAIFINATCDGANFKYADLRGADFSKAKLKNANFEGTKIHSIKLEDAEINIPANVLVDTSENGDGSLIEDFKNWYETNYRNL